MSDWFTIDHIDDKTHIISEYKHWEESHAYLLEGMQCSLLIDTGLGIMNLYDEVIKLTDKPIVAVATHIHWDHIGGHTPGHSPGHMCFYEKSRGYLFTGDLVYKDTLFAYYPSTDPAAYLASLEKISALPVTNVFPAHHDLNMKPEIVARMRDAFQTLKSEGKLRHGSGTFEYGDWAVWL